MNARAIEALGAASSAAVIKRLADRPTALSRAIRATHVALAPKLAFHLERLAVAEWDRREAVAAGHVALATRLEVRREAARRHALGLLLRVEPPRARRGRR